MLVSGRRDKVFCSSVCKSRYFRQQETGEHTTTGSTTHPVHQSMQAPLFKAPALTSSAPVIDVQKEEEDWEEEYQANQIARVLEEKLLREKQKAETLHAQYCESIETFLKSEGLPIYGRALTQFLDRLDDTVDAYRTHPGLTQTEDLSHARLADLYWVRDLLAQLLQELENRSFFAKKEVRFDLTKKKRNRFRQHLLV